MSLRDGTKKMSKSEASDLSRINMTDDADTIAKKIRKAKTDPYDLPSDPKGFEDRPAAENLVGIYAALSGETAEKVLKQFGGGQFSIFKNALADLAVAKLGPIGDEIKRLQADTAYVDSILADGSARARAICAPIVRETRKIVGFVVS
jgi:tryptophanyl-tRNA synthetase